MTNFERIADLVFRSLSESLTESEQRELDSWSAASQQNLEWYAKIRDEECLHRLFISFKGQQAVASKSRVLSRIQAEMNASTLPAGNAVTSAPVVQRVHLLKRSWFRYAAAVILFITGIGVYHVLNKTLKPGNQVVQTPSVPQDLPPGTNRAVLTLSDGSKVNLAPDGSSTIKDGSLSIENNRGHLSYKNADAEVMNTMTTPNGGQYQLTLADGTKVWLNAASSITYPTVFAGDKRQVLITGEAYFEVAKNKEKPFIVKTISHEIAVLGTSFNVNAYPDEVAMKASLVEGLIKIGDVLIKPGQAYQNGKELNTNIAQDIAWKNGIFNFENVSLAQAIRQLTRWYNVEAVYVNGVPDIKLGGSMDKSLTLVQALENLRDVNVNCHLEGRSLIIAQ